MSLTVTFENELSERLEREATQRQTSPEDLVTAIVNDAVPPQPPAWSESNQRRLQLIRKSVRESLTDVEQRELDDLQTMLDSRFPDFDDQLQRQLDVVRLALAATPKND